MFYDFLFILSSYSQILLLGPIKKNKNVLRVFFVNIIMLTALELP